MNVMDKTGQALLFGMVWSLMLLAFYLFLPRLLPRTNPSTRKALLLIGLIGLTARMVPNLVLPMGAGYDIESYRIVGDLVSRGQDVYSSPDTVNRHPYLPLQMYWMAFSSWIAGDYHLPFVQTVRMAPIVADVALSLFLFFRLKRSREPRDALLGGLIYALNPVPVFVSAYHGQFDALPLFAIVMALHLIEESPLLAGGWLGLGILDKSWPVLAFPSLFNSNRSWRARLFFVAAMVVLTAFGVALYMRLFHADLRSIVERALGYNWGIGVWGYTYFVRMLSVFNPDSTGLFHWFIRNGRYFTLISLSVVWFMRARKEAAAAGLLTILVTFLAITHAFSIQYLVWIVPFAILTLQWRWLARYTLGAFAYMLLTYTTLILAMNITKLLPWPQADWYIIMPAGLPAWLVLIGWTKARLLDKQ
jgi:hypothetical protein